jgi:hypothetical protein
MLLVSGRAVQTWRDNRTTTLSDDNRADCKATCSSTRQMSAFIPRAALHKIQVRTIALRHNRAVNEAEPAG